MSHNNGLETFPSKLLIYYPINFMLTISLYLD